MIQKKLLDFDQTIFYLKNKYQTTNSPFQIISIKDNIFVLKTDQDIVNQDVQDLKTQILNKQDSILLTQFANAFYVIEIYQTSILNDPIYRYVNLQNINLQNYYSKNEIDNKLVLKLNIINQTDSTIPQIYCQTQQLGAKSFFLKNIQQLLQMFFNNPYQYDQFLCCDQFQNWQLKNIPNQSFQFITEDLTNNVLKFGVNNNLNKITINTDQIDIFRKIDNSVIMQIFDDNIQMSQTLYYNKANIFFRNNSDVQFVDLNNNYFLGNYTNGQSTYLNSQLEIQCRVQNTTYLTIRNAYSAFYTPYTAFKSSLNGDRYAYGIGSNVRNFFYEQYGVNSNSGNSIYYDGAWRTLLNNFAWNVDNSTSNITIYSSCHNNYWVSSNQGFISFSSSLLLKEYQEIDENQINEQDLYIIKPYQYQYKDNTIQGQNNQNNRIYLGIIYEKLIEQCNISKNIFVQHLLHKSEYQIYQTQEKIQIKEKLDYQYLKEYFDFSFELFEIIQKKTPNISNAFSLKYSNENTFSFIITYYFDYQQNLFVCTKKINEEILQQQFQNITLHYTSFSIDQEKFSHYTYSLVYFQKQEIEKIKQEQQKIQEKLQERIEKLEYQQESLLQFIKDIIKKNNLQI